MLYFVYPETVKHREMEEWLNANVGTRDTAMHGWNWIGLPSGNCIGVRLPTPETIVAFKLRFPYPLHGAFEVLETTTYDEMAADRARFGI